MGKNVIIMGICGTGKSTISSLLAKKLSLQFLEGDEFHSKPNIDKMSSGTPLNDEDRLPWLKAINLSLLDNEEKGFVLSCSALKQSYRSILLSGLTKQTVIILLDGEKQLIIDRMFERDHFMPIALIDSQLQDLEITSDLNIIDINQSVEDIVDKILITLSS